ncbi:MAG: hypothetical protein WCK58_00570 [Chloroflexota bacterium]
MSIAAPRWSGFAVVLAAACLLLLPPAPAVAATDTDHDGLTNTFETTRSLTNPRLADTDHDGIRDGAEDPDHDTLTNLGEQRSGTNPRRADTDGDGLRDDREDADGDGLRNGFEMRVGTLPRTADTNGNGIRDGLEDRDGDGLVNLVEQRLGLGPSFADSDHDGTPDPLEDADHDGLPNLAELERGTNPLVADSDGDGTPDGAEIVPPAAAPVIQGAPGCTVFPADNVWNVRVDGRAVAPNSATMVASIGKTATFHMDFGSYAGYGIPYQVVDATTPRRTVTFDYADESDPGPYPIPATVRFEGGSDHHVITLDRATCRLYEMWDVRQAANGAWKAGSGAWWDLASNALRPAGWTSGDAAGLPILPGLVRYDEVVAGEIAHALRFTAPVTRRWYIYPARHFAADSTSASLPPMGLRLRLKATANLAGLSHDALVIAVALQRYGMILADNGSPWYVSGMSDPRFSDDVLHELDRFTGSDLEVVDTTGLVNGP